MAQIDGTFGGQWGDEGKGKQVDKQLRKQKRDSDELYYQAIVKPQGGANAGHTLFHNGKKFVGHLLPSGMFVPDMNMYIGAHVIVDPVQLWGRDLAEMVADKDGNKKQRQNGEIAILQDDFGIDITSRFYIAENAILQGPYDRIFEGVFEYLKESKNGVAAKVGGTGRGIAPSYANDAARLGLRAGDMLYSDFKERANDFIEEQSNLLFKYYVAICGVPVDRDLVMQRVEDWWKYVWKIKDHLVSIEYEMRTMLGAGKNVFVEGAQAALLDRTWGPYPYVTSSNTLPSVIASSLGVPTSVIGNICLVVKPYVTKVGGGHFPSRMTDAKVEAEFQKAGFEFGSTTGRPRQCGHFDLPLFARALNLTGASQLYISKADICPVDTMYMVESYDTERGYVDGFNRFPHRYSDLINPKLIEFPGWKKEGNDLSLEFYSGFYNYLENFAAQATNNKIKIIGIGTGENVDDCRMFD